MHQDDSIFAVEKENVMRITINTSKIKANSVGNIPQLFSQFVDKREGLIWVYLLSIANNDGMVPTSIYTISKELRIHRQTVTRIIKHLSISGWLSIEESADINPEKATERHQAVTPCVTSDVTSSVTSDVTFFSIEESLTTTCKSSRCQSFEQEGVTNGVTLHVTEKEKKEKNPPAPPKKEKKEKTTPTNAQAREKNQTEKLEQRRQQFLASLTPYNERYGQEMVTQFGDYWTEPNHTHTKMRFELQRTWSTPLRLATWARNDKRFTKSHNNYEKTTRPTAAELIANAQRTAIEETNRFIYESEIRRGGIPPHLPF